LDHSKRLPAIALLQGGFYLITGLWPLIDIDSFQRVTGPKTDLWLVRTVGVLVAVIGSVLIYAARNGRVSADITLLAVGCAIGLAAIDITYVLSGTISPVYLGDAVAELGLAGLWGLVRLRS
jgi:energy-converting hydrogenase Eha subunit E